MQCLMLLELSDLKLVSKMFSEFVKYNVRFKKISKLVSNISIEVL